MTVNRIPRSFLVSCLYQPLFSKILLPLPRENRVYFCLMNPRSPKKPVPRTALLYAGVLTLGAAGLLGNDANGRSAGLLFAAVGAGGLIWWCGQWMEWDRAKRAEETEARRRAELQATRREREAQERAQRAAERETQALAVAKLRDRREAERRAETERTGIETLLRLERDQKSEAEAERLRSLNDAQFAAEIAAIFTARGYRVERASQVASAEFLLSHPETRSRAVARCLPVNREATVGDGNALEAWRMEAGVEKAYLISARGFVPELVRLTRDRPLILVEPFLLAAWKE